MRAEVYQIRVHILTDWPHIHQTGQDFYYKDDLDEWIARAHRVTSTAQERQLAAGK